MSVNVGGIQWKKNLNYENFWIKKFWLGVFLGSFTSTKMVINAAHDKNSDAYKPVCDHFFSGGN